MLFVIDAPFPADRDMATVLGTVFAALLSYAGSCRGGDNSSPFVALVIRLERYNFTPTPLLRAYKSIKG